MSSKIKAFTVILKNDISLEHAEGMKEAIRYFEGVLDVKPSESDLSDLVAHSRIKNEIFAALLDLLKKL